MNTSSWVWCTLNLQVKMEGKEREAQSIALFCFVLVFLLVRRSRD